MKGGVYVVNEGKVEGGICGVEGRRYVELRKELELGVL